MTNRKFVAALAVAAAVALATAQDAAAQSGRGFFNPFFDLSTPSRLSVSPYGVISFAPLGGSAVVIGSESRGSSEVVSRAGTRPPYVPPTRSPFRPPVRPPFGS